MKLNKQSLYDILVISASENPHGYIYNFLGYRRTYHLFLEDVRKCASHLKSLGIVPGDIVSICLPNIPRALVLFYAINSLGGISNFIHPQIPIKDYEDLLKKIKPKALFVLSTFKNQQKAFKDLKVFDFIYLIKSNEFMTLSYKFITTPKEFYYKSLSNLPYYKEKHNEQNLDFQKDFNETAVILFSGGTTGTGKAICLSDVNINTCAIQTGLNRENGAPGDKILAILPMFHGYGLVSCIHTAVFEAGEILLLPYYQDKMFMKIFKRYRPNYITGIPKLYARMIPLLENESIDLSFLKGVFCGGSKLSESIRVRFNELLKEKNARVTIREGYGLTEMVSACTLMPKNLHKKNSIGKPFEGVKAKIVDPKSKIPLPLGSLGRIAFQSEAIMIGYFGQKEQPFFYDQDGLWLYTDDLGYMDSDGYLFFVDRIRRMLKICGYEVYPSTIEALFNEIPGIVNNCLVEYLDQGVSYLKLFVVIDKGHDFKSIKYEIMKKASADLPPWSIPKKIEIIDEIPQTLYKKNDYKKLSER